MNAVACIPTHSRRRTDIDAQAPAVLKALETGTYDQVATDFNTSRGKVYSLAVRAGARKNELRIQERNAERKVRQKEYLQQAINAIETADVLDFMAGLPDDSVPMFLTSPPYNIGRSYGSSPSADAHAFGYYVGWLSMFLAEVARTLQSGGVLFLQVGSTRDQTGGLIPIDVVVFDFLRSLGLTFQSRIAWCVPHGLTPKRRLSERYETALVFTKGPAPRVFNPNPVRTPQREPGKRAFKGPRKGELSGHPFGAWPSNVWPIPNASHNRNQDNQGHPAAMPAALARRAILLYSLPGDLIVDPFAGSGTTAAESLRTGRAFTGADLFYAAERDRRLAAVCPDLYTPLPGVTDESCAVWQAEARAVHVPAVAVDTQLCLLD